MYQKKYTIRELIEMLEKMPQDAIAAVKYRDEGGCYAGCDYDVEPFINDDPNTCEEGVVLL